MAPFARQPLEHLDHLGAVAVSEHEVPVGVAERLALFQREPQRADRVQLVLLGARAGAGPPLGAPPAANRVVVEAEGNLLQLGMFGGEVLGVPADQLDPGAASELRQVLTELESYL